MMKLKLEFLYTIFFVVAIFAFFLNIVTKTTFLLEFIVLVNLVVHFFQRKSFFAVNDNVVAIPLLAAFSFLLICIALLLHVKVDNEAYRLFFIPIAIFSFAVVDLDYVVLLRRLFWLCVIGAAYNIFDVVYFNLVLTGDLSRHFAAPALASLEDTQYDQLVSFFGLFPFFRPFGIFGQPQKSAFIAAIGILCYYYLMRLDGVPMRRGRAYFVCLYFLVSALVTGGTTGILASFMICVTIYAGEFGFLVSSLLAVIAVGSMLAATYFVFEHPLYYNAFAHDVSGLFSGDVFHLAFGNGFVSADDLFKEGFGHEHFIFRVLYEVGLFPFILWVVLLLFSVFRKGFGKPGLLLLMLLLMMVIHYSVTNVYFVGIFVCVTMTLLPRVSRA